MLEDARYKETEARLYLAESLEKLNRLPEAADQYRIMAQEADTEEKREKWLKHSEELIASSFDLRYDLLFPEQDFRMILGDERKIVPLYCAGCHKLLTEAAVYEFRKGNKQTAECWCGTNTEPLVKQDATHIEAVKQAKRSSQRSRAIKIASQRLADALQKDKATLLAFSLGWCGAHKFYLGEPMTGIAYLFWSWTCMPLALALYDAIILCHMSQVSFNMTYNFDYVLTQLRSEETEMFPSLCFEPEEANHPELSDVMTPGNTNSGV